jgi:hypothetical protein
VAPPVFPIYLIGIKANHINPPAAFLEPVVEGRRITKGFPVKSLSPVDHFNYGIVPVAMPDNDRWI